MKWSPIETAPKDGTPVLACTAEFSDAYGIGGHPITVHFAIFHPNAPGKGRWRDKYGHKQEFLTHWMPVPADPAKGKKK